MREAPATWARVAMTSLKTKIQMICLLLRAKGLSFSPRAARREVRVV